MSVIFVDPHYTSQTCSQVKCHYCNAKNRKSQSAFVCLRCGLTMNADKNAALNIQWVAVNQPLVAGFDSATSPAL